MKQNMYKTVEHCVIRLGNPTPVLKTFQYFDKAENVQSF
jgi:hypothetical protein